MFTPHSTLLAGMKNGDDVSWYQFRDTYRPLIFHCASQCGLPASGFPALEQDVLVAFFKASEKFEYNPEKGRFRTYLGCLFRHCIAQQKRKLAESDQLAEFGQDDFQDDAFDERWEKEWKRHVFWCAMKQVRRELPRKTVDVFERCDLKGEAPAAVAADMNISLATVYNYRSGVLARLRKFVREQDDPEEGTDETLR